MQEQIGWVFPNELRVHHEDFDPMSESVDSFTKNVAIWNKLGKSDPMWAVLSDPAKKHNRWDPRDFFASGDKEVGAVVNLLAGNFPDLRYGSVLDFGCGLGRLSQGFATYFDTVFGVDVSASMIEEASQGNPPKNITYRVNSRPDLSLFADHSFDFIYSRIVLQHIPPSASLQYIKEFVRTLKPGGVALFQCPEKNLQLPHNPFQHQITIEEYPSSLPSGRAIRVQLRIKNSSSAAWFEQEDRQLYVGDVWYDTQGERLVARGKTLLPVAPLQSGEAQVVPFELQVPATELAELTFGFDLTLQGNDEGWFSEGGARIIKYTLAIGADSAIRIFSEPAPVPSLQEKLKRFASHNVPSFYFLAKALHKQWLTLSGTGTEGSTENISFSMYAIPRHEVAQAVASAGGEIVRYQTDYSAGICYSSVFYWVKKS